MADVYDKEFTHHKTEIKHFSNYIKKEGLSDKNILILSLQAIV
jgi:hypothetical protein